jgi:hypothetical protein
MAATFFKKLNEPLRGDLIGVFQVLELHHIHLVMENRTDRAYGHTVAAEVTVRVVDPCFRNFIGHGETTPTADGHTGFASGTNILVDYNPRHCFLLSENKRGTRLRNRVPFFYYLGSIINRYLVHRCHA